MILIATLFAPVASAGVLSEKVTAECMKVE